MDARQQTPHPAGTLPAQRFRFLKRGGEFNWFHPAEIEPGDLDCSDMTDAQFELVVAQASEPGAAVPVTAEQLRDFLASWQVAAQQGRFS